MINIDALNDDEKLAALESIHKSIAESKEIQKKKITTNVELIVKALKKIESDLKQRYDETGQLIANLKNGEDGRDGKDGKDGKNGRDGRDGPVGPRGYDGLPGRNGIDGTDGVSVTDAHIDFDGSLIISLSSGRVINVGEVVAADIAEKIKVITNGGGTSQGVLDAIASLQAQIDSIASGLEYQGTWNASTNVPTLASSVGTAGYYYIVATAGSTNLNGVTDWQIGDWAVFNGSVWQKIDQTNLVTSVAGRTGAVTLSTSDISGLGTIATQAANNVSITGGSITGITDLAIADGGTGQSTAAAAITALTGTQTSGYYLRSNGTSASLSAISAGDVPTLNQNTTGTAAGLSATLATTSGGTGLTSFTANGIVYASSTSALATGSNLTYNGTALTTTTTSGIPLIVTGTGSVGARIIGGTGSGFGSYLSFQAQGANAAIIGTDASISGSGTSTNLMLYGYGTNSIIMAPSTAEEARFTSTGLGIGTTSPAAKLDLSANAVVMGYFRSSGGSANDQRLTFTSAGGRVVLDAATNSTGASSAFGFTLGGTEGMRLTTTGLGIGTTSPTNALSVTGNANITGNTTLGDATTDTVQVNGYMGVGGAASAAYGLIVRGDTTTGANQYGVASISTLSGTTWSSSVLTGPVLKASTAYNNVAGLRVIDSTTASGATVGSLHGIRIEDQTLGTNNYGITSLVSSGTNKWNIYASGTAQNYFAGSVGIGTSSPSQALTISSGNILLGNDYNLYFGGTNTYVSGNITGNNIKFGIGGSEQMRLTATGLGIGTSSPAAKVHSSLSSSGATSETLRLDNPSDSANAGTKLVYRISGWSFDGGFASLTRDGSGGGTIMAFGTSANASTTNASEKLRIDSAGNVGIGTSSPNASAILDIQSTTKGVRMPNMTTTQKNAIASPAAGLMVFDTTLAKLCVYSGTAWETITSI